MTTTAHPTLAPTATRWSTLRVETPGPRTDTDRVLLDHLAPAAESAIAEGLATSWFFIRYSEGGEHVRWRLRDAAPDAVCRIAGDLHAATGRSARPGGYEPEPERYGGGDHLAGAEEVFTESTRLAVRLLGGLGCADDRLGLGTGIVVETSRGLGLRPADIVSWLRVNAYSWRWHLPAGHRPGAPGVLTSALRAGRTRAEAVRARVHADTASPWQEIVARGAHHHRHLPEDYRRAIWASHTHMMLNRLGISPDEERWIEWFIASALETPSAPPRWFADGLEDPDRSYLAASRYVPELMPDQAPGDHAPPRTISTWNPLSRGGTALPAADLPDVTLASALTRRVSRRGPYGPVTAPEIGRLLWGASAAPGAGLLGRTYPSAGGQYAARLRLLALTVDGIEPGLYEADVSEQAITRLAPVPEPGDLASMSMWLRNADPGPSQIDVTALPALIAVYLDLTNIRARYGLRALRMALLEAGHLTQNLALVAAATDLQLCPVGGLYDDYAHDVLHLDGVDRVLAYLLPVGGVLPTGGAQRADQQPGTQSHRSATEHPGPRVDAAPDPRSHR